MTESEFLAAFQDTFRSIPENFITADIALRPDLAGMRMYDDPVVGFADPDDSLFLALKQPEAIGPHFLLPRDWLPDAGTVICFYLPNSEAVRKSNAANFDWPSDEWLHARIEGQAFIDILLERTADMLRDRGCSVNVPFHDKRFKTGNPMISDKSVQGFFTSNWSERHAAFVAGLGTFCLSRSLITARGVSVRFGSLIVSDRFETTPRPYTGIYEYCNRCGVCASHCPAGAITLEAGKAHPPCSDFLDSVRAKCAPRYGCGKCQTAVPCEAGIPGKMV
jgi:epoxyqueuosine reductase QueG